MILGTFSKTGAERSVRLQGLVSIQLWKKKTDMALYFKMYVHIRVCILSVTKYNIRSEQLLTGTASWPKIFHGLQLNTRWPLYKYLSVEVELPLC